MKLVAVTLALLFITGKGLDHKSVSVFPEHSSLVSQCTPVYQAQSCPVPIQASFPVTPFLVYSSNPRCVLPAGSHARFLWQADEPPSQLEDLRASLMTYVSQVRELAKSTIDQVENTELGKQYG